MARVESYTAEHIDGMISTLSQQLASLTISVNGRAKPEDIANALADLVGSAPQTLNTLGEIADAFQDNPQIIPQMLESIGLRVTTSTFNAHTADTAAHGATSSPTASTIARRDASGKLRAATPISTDASDTLVNKAYSDARTGRFMGDWSSGTQYYPGDMVINLGRFYRSLLASNTTAAPTHTTTAGNTTQWALSAVSIQTETSIGDIIYGGEPLSSTTNLPTGLPDDTFVLRYKG